VKISTRYSVDERADFVTAQVGRHACALNKSVLAINVSASLIWESMFQVLVKIR